MAWDYDPCDGSGILLITTEDGEAFADSCHACPMGAVWREIGLEPA